MRGPGYPTQRVVQKGRQTSRTAEAGVGTSRWGVPLGRPTKSISGWSEHSESRASHSGPDLPRAE